MHWFFWGTKFFAGLCRHMLTEFFSEGRASFPFNSLDPSPPPPHQKRVNHLQIQRYLVHESSNYENGRKNWNFILIFVVEVWIIRYSLTRKNFFFAFWRCFSRPRRWGNFFFGSRSRLLKFGGLRNEPGSQILETERELSVPSGSFGRKRERTLEAQLRAPVGREIFKIWRRPRSETISKFVRRFPIISTKL